MISREITIQNESGLHARPATFFAQKANNYHCDIWIERDDRKINAKSLLGILSLGIGQGSVITLTANGPDEKEAFACLEELVNKNFAED